MTLQDLIQTEEKLQPHLLNTDYTFIGPSDLNLLGDFMQKANALHNPRSYFASIHDALSDKSAVLKALNYLPSGSSLRIFIMSKTSHTYLMHTTVEAYCKEHNIIL